MAQLFFFLSAQRVWKTKTMLLGFCQELSQALLSFVVVGSSFNEECVVLCLVGVHILREVISCSTKRFLQSRWWF